MTPELYKYWYEGGKLEYRYGPEGYWHTVPARTGTATLTINAAFEFRKKKNPHKHAEVIKAWADGAKIEVKSDETWSLVTRPQWLEHYEYRIKAE